MTGVRFRPKADTHTLILKIMVQQSLHFIVQMEDCYTDWLYLDEFLDRGF